MSVNLPLSSKKQLPAAFTLLEVLVVIAIIGMLTALAATFYYSFAAKTNLTASLQDLINTLRQAQSNAQTVYLNSEWGVYFTNNSYTLFKGISYASRDPVYDQNTTLANTITLTTDFGPQMIFSKNSGQSLVTGKITLTDTSNQSLNVSLNAAGRINF